MSLVRHSYYVKFARTVPDAWRTKRPEHRGAPMHLDYGIGASPIGAASNATSSNATLYVRPLCTSPT
jgi:hypothetical protein